MVNLRPKMSPFNFLPQKVHCATPQNPPFEPKTTIKWVIFWAVGLFGCCITIRPRVRPRFPCRTVRAGITLRASRRASRTCGHLPMAHSLHSSLYIPGWRGFQPVVRTVDEHEADPDEQPSLHLLAHEPNPAHALVGVDEKDGLTCKICHRGEYGPLVACDHCNAWLHAK